MKYEETPGLGEGGMENADVNGVQESVVEIIERQKIQMKETADRMEKEVNGTSLCGQENVNGERSDKQTADKEEGKASTTVGSSSTTDGDIKTSDGQQETSKASAKPKSVASKVRMPSTDAKSGCDSRRSSVSVTDIGSRRGSLVMSPLGSFSNIQEKIQALSRDQSQSDVSVKRKPKVKKLNEDMFKIVKLGKEITYSGPAKPKEPVRIASNVDVQSKLMKFGEKSGGKTSRKSSLDVGQSSEVSEKMQTASVEEKRKNINSKMKITENDNETKRTGAHKETQIQHFGETCREANDTTLIKMNDEKSTSELKDSFMKKETLSSVVRKEEYKTSTKTSTVVTTEHTTLKDEVKELIGNDRHSVGPLNTSRKPPDESLEEEKVKGSRVGEVLKSEDKREEFEETGNQVVSPIETAGAKPSRLSSPTPSVYDNVDESTNLQEELVREAMKVQESMKILTRKANKGSEDDSASTDISKSESMTMRKDEKSLMKKLKKKSNPNECYPKTQKLLIGKPINEYEKANLEESRHKSLVSPTKVEAFLRDNLNPPPVVGKDPVRMMEAVVEEIVTSKSNQLKHEKPTPSQIKFSSKGEVITGAISIKPAGRDDQSDLSAITLVPAFRPQTSIFDQPMMEEKRDVSSYLGPEQPGMSKAPEEERAPTEDFNKRSFNRERSTLSPLSDFSDESFDHYVPSIDLSVDSYSYDQYSRRRFVRSSSTPRRIFPQVARPPALHPDKSSDDSSTVFDASMSFDLASNRTSLRQQFKPQPAFSEEQTASNSLSLRIAEFLNRTDHIMEEWRHLGKGGDDLQSLVQLPASNLPGQSSTRRKSATNILIKGMLNFTKGSRNSSVRSRSTARTPEACDRTISDIDELSEMTMDLSEERATGTMQAERLEAETAERVKLEQELSQIQHEKKNLQQASERLEMELFYARADVNGLSESEGDLEDGGGDAALYKNKCERAMRELEFTRRRLQQQHEDDLEQLVALKKQLEKKLSDAYEEVDEQRQVAGQWKRKVQKLQSEMNDLRLLLEVQSSRNNLLEKKQRKFDSEIQLLQDELRSEKNQKEHLSREKDMAFAEKYSMEQNLSSVRLELELKDEKLTALARELEEFSRGGGSEQEVTQLRKAKHDLEMKLKEQEEELDELAGQVSMLEGNKLRLEMSLESLRKEHRREMAQRDDELDEARSNSQKKIKVLESQLESEHEERTLLVREKHELERRLANAEERGRHNKAADEDALLRARRDLKKTKALLRDAQVMLERAKQDSPTKAALRALKNQLEDAELARASAVKAKQSLDSELSEVNGMLEEALRTKGDAENRCQAAVREMNALRTQVDENEEELAELLKKYRQTVQQLSAEQLSNQETAGALAEAEAERQSLRDQLAELTARLEANAVTDPINGLAQKKLEIRIKELENRLDMEQTTRGRLETKRKRGTVERGMLTGKNQRANGDRPDKKIAEVAEGDQRGPGKAPSKGTRGLPQKKRTGEEASRETTQFMVLETAEHEASTARTDLRLAVKRIEDLQSAISGEIGSDSERTESEEDDSGDESLISHVASTISSTSRTSRTPDLTPR
ncbi:hypothetical protein RUM43_011270 [Polyplax serrata]|uniref:Unconventional myosin-XVIIIa-like n=1 Tax=Polyplax serrata TaxID=468196 RepID=A0AAN8P8U9_POLSC